VPIIGLTEERAIVTDVNGVLVSVNVKGRAPRDVLPEGNERAPVDNAGGPLLPVTIAVTLPVFSSVLVRVPLTVKLTSVNVDPALAVIELGEITKSLGIASVPRVFGVSVAA
jgi:hypothetical protein